MEAEFRVIFIRGRKLRAQGEQTYDRQLFPSILTSVEVWKLWTVLYVAPNQTTAHRIKDFMETEGILIRLRPIGLRTEGSYTNYEILVTEAEIEEAQEVLNQALQVRLYRE